MEKKDSAEERVRKIGNQILRAGTDRDTLAVHGSVSIPGVRVAIRGEVTRRDRR
jgi:hypothetical protein